MQSQIFDKAIRGAYGKPGMRPPQLHLELLVDRTDDPRVLVAHVECPTELANGLAIPFLCEPRKVPPCLVRVAHYCSRDDGSQHNDDQRMVPELVQVRAEHGEQQSQREHES